MRGADEPVAEQSLCLGRGPLFFEFVGKRDGQGIACRRHRESERSAERRERGLAVPGLPIRMRNAGRSKGHRASF